MIIIYLIKSVYIVLSKLLLKIYSIILQVKLHKRNLITFFQITLNYFYLVILLNLFKNNKDTNESNFFFYIKY